MSKKEVAEDISEGYQQSLNAVLESISENQGKLIKETSEFYATYFSITSEIIRKSFDYYMSLMSNLPMYPTTFFNYRSWAWPGITRE
jgi:hypothetical protein